MKHWKRFLIPFGLLAGSLAVASWAINGSSSNSSEVQIGLSSAQSSDLQNPTLATASNQDLLEDSATALNQGAGAGLLSNRTAEISQCRQTVPFIEGGETSSPPIDFEVAALQDRFWSGFNPLIDPADIVSGGVAPDGIPPIDNPTFLHPTEIDFLADTEPVISLEINCEVRAYPVQILTWHEIVNDVVGGVPVTVTYCPLCNSSLAYDRRLDELVLDFGTSGSLYNSSLVMYDRQSYTLWTHFDGRAVIGELEGAQLEFFPISIVSWGDWKSANPNGMVLNRVFASNGSPIRSYGTNPYGGYLQSGDPLSYSFLDEDTIDDRLPLKTLVVGVRSEQDSVAILRDSLAEAGVIDTRLGRTELTIWQLSGTNSALDSSTITNGIDVGSVAVFEKDLDGQTLDFERTERGFRDLQTGSVWNIFGEAISGELQGSQLNAREFLDTFWFAWSGFNPDTRIVGG